MGTLFKKTVTKPLPAEASRDVPSNIATEGVHAEANQEARATAKIAGGMKRFNARFCSVAVLAGASSRLHR